ncbi:hypothetical protein AB5J62_04240 [Amycolatopsis sp. cg5]|uniref:hypothetical protein n=1 Tax=Amycolatopsis sp. cg5 TaxID=3238802 RepID=UPI00352587B4
MVEMPVALRAKAEERGLGECVRRYRRRPGVLGTFCAVLPLIGAAMGATVGGDPMRALGIVMFLWPPIFLSWCSVTRKRLDGGAFVFTGGFAEVYGRKVREAVTWDEVGSVRLDRTLYVLNFLVPWGYSASCRVQVRGRRDDIVFDNTYRHLRRLADDIHRARKQPLT